MCFRKYIVYIAVVALMLSLCGCSTETAAITSLSELNSKQYTLGGTAGTAAASMLEEVYINPPIKYYNQLSDGYLAVQKGKIDGFTYNRPNLEYVVAHNPDLFVMPDSLGSVDIVVGTKLGNDELMEKINTFITQYQADGTYDDMYNRWITEAKEDMPFANPTSGDTLTVGLDAQNQPFNYIKDGEVAGFDAEFAYRLAAYLGMKVEFAIMNYDVLVPAGISGKIDVIISNLNATPERRENMLLSEPYLVSEVSLIIRRTMYADTEWTDYMAKLPTSTVGVMTGSLGETVIEKQYPTAKRRSFDNYSDILAALKAGKIDYMIANETSLMRFVLQNPGLMIVGEPLTKEGAAVAVAKGNAELLSKIDSLLTHYKTDGTLDAITKHWVKPDGTPYEPMDVPEHESGKVLRIAISADMEPMCFVMDNEYAGIDIELARRLCYDLGYIPEFQNMKFAGVIASLQSGKSDAIISNMTRTEERALSVDFSQDYFLNPQMLLVVGSAETEVTAALYKRFVDSFNRTFIVEDRYKLILNGLAITLIISILSLIGGTLLGALVCAAKMSKRKIFNIPALVYVRIIQGTPIVVLLMILYYIIFGGVDVLPFLIAVVGFSLNFAAYASEMFRTAIIAVDRGQVEAAQAIGYSKFQTFLKIILPQAARQIIPVFKGEFVSMVKMTSVVGYIAIQDLTKASDIIRSRTYDAFFPLICTAFIYFVITYILIWGLQYIEISIDPKRRKRIIKGITTRGA